jgi:hypothetical protein
MFRTHLLLLAFAASLSLGAHTRRHVPTAEQSLRQVATLRAARAAHTATTLSSGDVLIVGGMTEGGGALSSVERFAPRDSSIREVASLATARVGHTATYWQTGAFSSWAATTGSI